MIKKLSLIKVLVLFTVPSIDVFGMKVKIEEKKDTIQQSVQDIQAEKKFCDAEKIRLIKAIEQRKNEIDQLEEEYMFYSVTTETFYNSRRRNSSPKNWQSEKRIVTDRMLILENEIQALEIQLSNL